MTQNNSKWYFKLLKIFFFIKIRQSDATENAFDIIRDTVH